ncbi:elongation factor G-like protein EF-G2 [Salinispora arenicola]|uniref:Elongation factor G n=1 Tax=Salinispora arenicola TaxID=168697 RepID=A0A542XU04_SALAC|nr:elongation factor G-like protein EF-G2 [Salinispora arenicola]MCN0153932.1 elongation factor G-like protein EF-G2 [Salinispora arenicola]MCN0178783.1 elongation factor G-like protein EF-G2 [Salinispora arenicola]NIL61321.1 elongation factor G-like protein EF-G2 [Salinispora arenicola]TQL39317.1 translation elongation factor 2 (EF-2/EF-G) [Salinispora arenicola]GIM87766.1 elongation factor G [Salinispora arenicola]
MAQKSQDKGVAGGMPVVTHPDKIRNVVLVGHSGAGKTTLVEALLAATGTIGRTGNVTDGSTTCDHDPAAIRQQRSVTLACAPLMHDGIKVNLLDTPGYADFVGELRAGLRAADAALFVVSAVDGMDATTAALWEECAAVDMPRAVAVSRLDHPRADFDEAVALCQRVFGDNVLPLYLPMLGDDGVSTAGLLGLITRRVLDYTAGLPAEVRQPDPEHLPAIAESRNELIEGIIAESEDETLMDRYLEGAEIDTGILVEDLEKAVARGHFYPVVPVCAQTGVGIDALLEVLTAGFPSPLEHDVPAVTGVDGAPRPPLTCDPAGPLVAEVVKTTVDRHVGRVSLVRIFSGTLRPEQVVHVSGHGLADRGHPDHDADERVAHLYSPLGATLREVSMCVAGDLCALTKSGSAETGDTISAKDDPLLVAPWEMPEPLLPVAIVARTRADEDALARNLARLVAGDPTLRLDRNSETRQLVLWCMGEAHADVVLDRLRSGGVELDTAPVRVALRETFTVPAKGHGRHVKQSGGHGQYAVCDIEVEPLPRGDGFEFVNRVVGGAVPHNYIPSVEKGVRAQLERGLAAGAPLVDLRVTLVDGKAHSVDSSDAAFQTAGALALRDAADKGQPALLEPVDEVIIRVPDSSVGAVLGDLSGRRGRVLGTEPDTAAEGRTLVRAEVPATELLRYAVELRSMTSGTGTFGREFARYEPMPSHQADRFRTEHA